MEDLKEELKQKLFDMGVLKLDTYASGDSVVYFSGYPFTDLDGWPLHIDTSKEKYEYYKRHPEEWGDDLPATLEEFRDEEDDEVDELLDTENCDVEKFEIVGDKIELTLFCGGDWQMCHKVKIVYHKGGKFEIEDLGVLDDDEFFTDCATEKFLHEFGYKATWEK